VKKPYFLFAGILIVIILAFIFGRGYLDSLEKETKSNTTQAVQKSELEEFKQEVEKRIDESEAAFFARLDSLEQKFRETEAPDSLAAPAVTTPPVQAKPVVNKPADTAVKSAELSQKVDSTPINGYVPSEEENEIYLKYLKRRWALAADLTAYELKLAKDEIMQDVGRQYSMTAEEVLQLIDRVYDYRKAKKQK